MGIRFSSITYLDESFPIKLWWHEVVPNTLASPHRHESFEMLYIEKGNLLVKINDTEYDAKEGEIVIINCWDLHSTFSKSKVSTRYLLLQFDVKYFKPLLEDTPNKNYYDIFIKGLYYPNPISSSGEIGLSLLNCISEMLEYYNNIYFFKKKGFFEIFIRSGVYKLVGLLLTNYHKDENIEIANKLSLTNDMLRRILIYVHDNYSKDITLEDAAELVNISVRHFTRLFRIHTNMSFKDFLLYYRIEVSEKLLKTSKSVSEIAKECGFNNNSSFFKAFRKYKNCTPAMYRKHLVLDKEKQEIAAHIDIFEI